MKQHTINQNNWERTNLCPYRHKTFYQIASNKTQTVQWVMQYYSKYLTMYWHLELNCTHHYCLQNTTMVMPSIFVFSDSIFPCLKQPVAINYSSSFTVLLTIYQTVNFGLDQIQSICRRQNKSF